MLKLFMFNWVGRFSLLLILTLSLLAGPAAVAAEDTFVPSADVTWSEFSRDVALQERRDAKNGLSYIISGSLALAGGLVGNGITNDSIEKGIYTVFQSIGIASIGYGSFVWKIGGEERALYKTLQESRLTAEQKTLFLRSYVAQRKERESKERVVKAITHGLIAGLNFYNASQQKQTSIKTGLNFIGGVNLLAALTYTFDF